MYLPRHFAQPDAEAVEALMRDFPLATLVTHGPEGLSADPIPLTFDRPGPGPGRLRGHVARANPIWQMADGQPVLAVFSGPQAYVSPSAYPSKAEHHKVVPTWNYAVVHAHGHLRAIDDPTWLRGLVAALTQRHESGRALPWSIDDAPADYIDQMLGAIVGIQIELTDLVGKWKLSQNRSSADRTGVADDLDARGEPSIARWVRPPAT